MAGKRRISGLGTPLLHPRYGDLVIRRGLHFGQTRQTGIVFHMLSALASTGRIGLTAVGNTPEEAREIFDQAHRVLDEEARFDELEL